MGAHRAPIIGRDLFFLFFVVARPLAFGSLPARIMPTLRVGIWEIRRISHYKSRFIFIFIRARTYTRGNSPNLGHFSRDLGQNLRVTFRDRTPIG